ncbi:Ig-like domain-containing protein, partial [Rhodonellum sp.]|uniref:Ig-like domain-containing protein n=1 Tax=Rhodonellum sp. TaxID=2231180 RepID=UPI00271C0B35
MKKTSANLIKATFFSFLFLICLVAYPTTFHFSSSLGDDARSIAQAQNENTPWKSIQKLNSIFNILRPGDKILFKNGDAFYGTLSITKSGTAGAPISFGSYGSGVKPIITSLVTVSNWISKGGNIYEANVEVEDALNIVLLDGKAQAMGRFPNPDAIRKGYLTISSTSGGNIVSPDLQAPVNFTGGEIVIRKNNWIIDRHYIDQHSGTSINYNTTGSNYSPKVGFGFFIQNHPGTLDQNGEWFFNKKNKTLQIYYDRGDLSSANIQVALNNQVIDIKQGISNITFSNLSILGANENLVSLSSSSNISFTSSELKFAGKNGIHAVVTTNFIIQNSLVEDMHNSGLFFQWQDVNMKILNNTFNRTHFFPGMGRNGDMNGNTIYMSETSGNGLVENNKILNSGYQGINFNGNNTIIKNNLVDMFCFVKDDGAGIYTHTGSANTTLTNRKVINNIVINGIGAVDGTKPYGPKDFPYVEGIYMDDNSTGVEISGNTVANVASSGIYIHNSRSIDIFQNNIYNVGNSILFAHDNLGDANRNINMKNNKFLAKDTNQSHIFVRSKLNDVALMGTFDQNVFARPVNESNTITLQTPAKNGLIDLQTWKDSYGLDKNSTKSPVAFDPNKMDIEEFILFDYNYSNSVKSLPLSGTYVDLRGQILSGSVSIPAYSSVMLLKSQKDSPLENVAPTVTISSPSQNASFFIGENISITADASDADGNIAKVEFYYGNTLLGTDTTLPYSFTWANLPMGSFALTAKATDNKGTSTVSSVVNINVV